MARDYKRAPDGKFATTGTSKAEPVKAAPAKSKQSTAKRAAAIAGAAVAVGATAGVLKVRHDALARYGARAAGAALRASDVTSSW
jgi:hypothetical protein